MRTFHFIILAYALTMMGCGYKGMPFWKEDAPKQPTSQTTPPTSQGEQP